MYVCTVSPWAYIFRTYLWKDFCYYCKMFGGGLYSVWIFFFLGGGGYFLKFMV